MNKQTTLYQVREFIGGEYSKALGRRLRTRQQASRIVKILKAEKRSVFLAPIKVAI
jgi:hypothetical protein